MSVASKNLYALLGNDDESDAPAAPVKTVDKTTTHTTKRNTDGLPPARNATAASSTRRGGSASGNEAAFRDRAVGSDRNHGRPTEGGAPRGASRGRGGRGGRFSRERDDRHTKGAPGGGSDKQAAQGWGANEGDAELKDEQAGEEIAQAEQKEVEVEAAEEALPEEPEEKQVSYSEYLAQQAERKLNLAGENVHVRQANEGAKENKKWANAKALAKDEEEGDFIAGSGGKAKREREKKVKQLVDIDNRFIAEPERPRGGGRGGRGGPRGDFRGGRGDRGDRGDHRGDRGDRAEGGRGDSGRGGRGDGNRGGPSRGRGGPRGDFRGGRGGRDNATSGLNTKDESAFPSLGS